MNHTETASSHKVTKFRTSVVAAVLTVLAGCGGGGSSDTIVAPPINGCSIAEQNQFVIDLMRDIYYWVDEVPTNISANDFSSPEATMNAMLFTQLDRFSGIRDAAANDAFFSDSQFIGVGITLSFEENDRVFIAQTFSDGPAAAAGLTRGYELLQINGRSVSDIIAAGDSVSAAFGADEVGVNVDIRYRDLIGSEADVSFAKALVTIETVTLSSVMQVNGQTTGYLLFRNFVEPSFDALRVAFEEFAQAGATELILDLRYNGGGLVSVAEFLSNLLGGTTTDGQLLAQRVHNANNASRNVDTLFNDEVNALDLSNVVVITTGASASASELVINSLTPFVDVKIVGERSFGKPVGSYGFDFCDKVALPIAFANFNASDEGDYFDGFAVDCAATDDVSQMLGDMQENLLAEAVSLLSTGQCSQLAPAAKLTNNQLRSKRRDLRTRSSEFEQLVMAE